MTRGSAADTPSAYVSELAAVIAAELETTASIQPAEQAPSGGWLVSLLASDGASGSLELLIDRIAIESVAKRVTGQETEPTVEEMVRTLTEWCNTAAAAFLQHATLGNARLAVSSVSPVAARESAAGLDVLLGDVTIRLAIAGKVEAADPIESRRSGAGQTLEAILDIDLPVVVRFGRTEMTLKALTALGPGSVIDLGRSPDDPVDVLVSNQLLARGEVVIVGGCYGVRIVDVMKPSERMRSLGEMQQ